MSSGFKVKLSIEVVVMERNRVEFRIRIGNYEVEIKGSIEDIEKLLEKTIDYVSKVKGGFSLKHESIEAGEGKEVGEVPPLIEISGRESVTSVLSKLFSTHWASKPRTLREVMDVLESLGLHYPKSTIAVSLARLVKRNVIRRIKKENMYVYVPVKPILE